jgi:hypothetical protein
MGVGDFFRARSGKLASMNEAEGASAQCAARVIEWLDGVWLSITSAATRIEKISGRIVGIFLDVPLGQIAPPHAR